MEFESDVLTEVLRSLEAACDGDPIGRFDVVGAERWLVREN